MALTDRRIIFRAALAAVLVSATALSACGRNGPLEPPPAAAVKDADGVETDAEKAGAPKKPERPFVLDAII